MRTRTAKNKKTSTKKARLSGSENLFVRRMMVGSAMDAISNPPITSNLFMTAPKTTQNVSKSLSRCGTITKQNNVQTQLASEDFSSGAGLSLPLLARFLYLITFSIKYTYLYFMSNGISSIPPVEFINLKR